MATPKKPAATDRLLQQANQLSDPQLERLIELLSLLLEARQFPPFKQGHSEQTEEANQPMGKAHIELKYIPDSRGSGAVYGP